MHAKAVWPILAFEPASTVRLAKKIHARKAKYGRPPLAFRPHFRDVVSMKITQIVCQILRVRNVVAKTASSQDAVLVRVRTDTGLEGIGEADASPEVVKAIVDAPFSHNIACGLREILVGENPLETERLWQKMYRRTMYFGRTSVSIAAMAAVDMALWDLKGKHFGEPIHRLLGGKQHERIKAYASILFGRDGRETADIARRWRAPATRPSSSAGSRWARAKRSTSSWCAAPAKASATATLLIDAGCVWDARTALRRAHAFAEFNIDWLEEPLRRGRRRRLRLAARPLAGADRLGRRRVRPRGVPPVDRPPRARRLPGRSVAQSASPTRPTFAPASKRSAPGCAITATPAR